MKKRMIYLFNDEYMCHYKFITMNKNNKIIISDRNCLTLRTKKYPKGGMFLIIGTKTTKQGYSHRLKDIQTNEYVLDCKWLDSGDIEKMKL